MENHYDILQVSPNAEPEVIKAAYRGLAFKYHPDRNSDFDSTKKMKLLVEAYEILSDTEKRRLYDEELKDKVLTSRDIALTLVDRGNALLEQGEHEAAIVLFSEAIQLNGKLAKAFHNRGVAYAHLKAFGRAIEDFENACLLDPDDSMANRNLQRASESARAAKAKRNDDGQVSAKKQDPIYEHASEGTEDFLANRPSCPKCQAPMAIRMGANGPYFDCLCPLPSGRSEATAWPEVPNEADAPQPSAPEGPSAADAPQPSAADEVYGRLELILGSMAMGSMAMGAIGAWAAKLTTDGTWGFEGMTAGVVLGTISGVILGVSLGICMWSVARGRKGVFLWSALCIGAVCGAFGGAISGIVAASTGSIIWGGTAGLAMGIAFGLIEMLTVVAFWENARWNVVVALGAIATAAIGGLVVHLTASEIWGLDGLDGGAIWGAAFGGLVGGIFGSLVALSTTTESTSRSRAASAWRNWMRRVRRQRQNRVTEAAPANESFQESTVPEVVGNRSFIRYATFLGVVCGVIAGTITGSIAGWSGSALVAIIIGIPIGAFFAAVEDSVISALSKVM